MSRDRAVRFAAASLLLLSLTLVERALAAPGDLDTSFGGDGVVTTPIGSSEAQSLAEAVAVQADGKIVVAGTSSSPGADFTVVRYDSDSTLDGSFGGSGIVTTPLESGGAALAVIVQADQKIVAIGAAGNAAHPFDDDFALVRYNSDGTLDGSFGASGKVDTPVSASGADIARAAALQSDGKIVAAGLSNGGDDADFAVVRYLTDGSLDTSFGGTGKVSTDFADTLDNANAVAIQADGKIVAAGMTREDCCAEDFALVRYASDGTLDASFGTGGKVVTDFAGFADVAYGVAIQADGKIVVAGASRPDCCDADFALARYESDGTLDASFGTGGLATTTIPGFGEVPSSMVLQGDGKIVVAGVMTRKHQASVRDHVGLMRYDTEGDLDPSFDGDGIVITPIGKDRSQARALALQADGKIVVAPYAFTDDSFADFAVLRYERGLDLTCPAAPSSPCFDGFGRASLSVDEGSAGREKLVAKLLAEPSATLADLGDPLPYGGTAYTLCIYDDADDLAGTLGVDRAGLDCSNADCWKAISGGSGFRYKDKLATVDGVTTIKLLAGGTAGARISLQARNSATKGQTSLPTGIAAALAGSSSATVQVLRNDAPQCFSADLGTVLANDAGRFKARQ